MATAAANIDMDKAKKTAEHVPQACLEVPSPQE